MRNRRLTLALLALFGLLLYTAGCDSADNPIAPPGAVITMSANPTQINLNGQFSTISIVGFRPDGNPLNPGTQVNLSTDLGVLAQSVIEVGSGGRATTTLSSDGRPGMATITASLPGAGDASAMVSVLIGEDMSTQETLSITATPSRLNIEQSSTISVIARNADGSRAPGQQVTLRTSLGRLDSELLTTDGNGEASTTLRPDGRSGMVDITGSVGSGMETMVQLTILRTQLIVQAFPDTLDIQEISEITVLIRDEDSLPLVAGHEVRLTANLGQLVPEIIQTDSNGEGRSRYTAADRAGSDTVTAFIGNSDPGTADITIRDAPDVVTLDVSPTSFTPSTDGTDFQLVVRVSNAEGEPLVNEIVRFTVVEAADPSNNIAFNLQPAGGPSSDAAGRAEATLTITANAVDDVPAGTDLLFRAFVRDVASATVGVGIQGQGGGGG